MADRPPFGFGPPGRPGDDDPKPGDQGPFGPFGGPGGGPGGPNQFADALRQFADLLSYSGGPVNWELAKNLARHAIAAKGDPSVLANERAAVTEAVRLADLWLDDVTTFPSGIRKIEAWSQSEWLEATFPVWSSLCEPVAAKGVDAMSSILNIDPAQLGEDVPEQMRAALSGLGGLSGLAPMLRQLGGAMIGGQTGSAVGEMAGEMVSSTDIGLPLGPEGTAALLPSGVAAFGEGLSVDIGEVRLFLALREAAHHRLFGHVPWLRQHLFGAVEAYAAGITVDMSRLREAMPDIDMGNPEALREALAGETLFRPEDTPQQKAALARLETALALVEGWVATVVAAAAGPRMTHADALAEAIRRRRASGGPAERTFATLVGLELRPRMLREAAALWGGLTAARGVDGRDALWAHPDLLPTAEDLEDPDSFVRGSGELDISGLEDDSGEEGHTELPGSLATNSTYRLIDAQNVSAWCHLVTMRPALKAGLRPVWRDRDTLQIGVDPRRAAAVTGLGRAVALLSLLDGSREEAEVVRAAAARGIAPETADRVLGLLASVGVLDDFPAHLHHTLPDYLRARLAPELACAALAYGHGDGGARVIAARRAAFVRVYGAGRVGGCIATFLAASGVAWVSCRDSGTAGPADIAPGGLGAADVGAGRAAGVSRAIRRVAPETRTADDATRTPDLAVLAGGADPVELAGLMRGRVPHLAVRADEAIGVVGPLVDPGRSACLHCVDLAKAARDRAWPAILAQAGGWAGPPASPQACDTVLAAATAALAAAQALAFIDRAGPPVTSGGTLELVLPDWRWRRRSWPPHAACTCGAARAAAGAAGAAAAGTPARNG
jgi:bacteriocin biosynthesis cyclodehydratase domain-containing protein